MVFGRSARWRVATHSRVLSCCTLCLFSAGLLAGCGEASRPAVSADFSSSETWAQTSSAATPQRVQPTSHQESEDEPRLAAVMPALDYLPDVDRSDVDVLPQPETERQEMPGECWSFSWEGHDETAPIRAPLIRLPAVTNIAAGNAASDNLAHGSPELLQLTVVEEAVRDFGDATTSLVAGATTTDIVDDTTHDAVEAMARDINEKTVCVNPFVQTRSEPDEVVSHERIENKSIANLLPPQVIFFEQAEAPQSPLRFSPADLSELPSEPLAPLAPLVQESTLPVLAALTEQEQLLATLLQDASSATTGVLTDSRINEVAKTKIQQAYAMASRGAYYVARQELIEVLRMISQAKDAQRGSPERTVALAAGLRALREAEDFAPHGMQLEAELDIGVLCASHRTPLAQQPDCAKLLPRLMMDRYLRYAQLQLALSVAGEPAGSMALHALGKLDSQLGRVEPSKHRLAERHAIAYQQAALLAHNQNHLAAHELGVLLATSGHFPEAEQLLKQVAAREPNAIVYRNLARIQDELGKPAIALASRDLARRVNEQGATGTNNVEWVAPAQFVEARSQAPRYASAQRKVAPQPASHQPSTDQLVIPGSRHGTPARRR